MSSSMKVDAFVRGIRSLQFAPNLNERKKFLNVLKDAFASDCLRDIANLLDGNFISARGGSILNFPSIGALVSCPKMMCLLDDASSNSNLQRNLSHELSHIVARLECIAYSKDMQAIWAQKKRSVSKSLQLFVQNIKNKWKRFLTMSEILKERNQLEKEIRLYITKDRKKYFVSAHSRWLKAMNYIFSTRNTKKYSTELDNDRDIQVTRMIDLDALEDAHKQTSLRVPKCVSRVLSSSDCNQIRKMDFRRQQQIKKVLRKTLVGRGDLLVGGEKEPRKF